MAKTTAQKSTTPRVAIPANAADLFSQVDNTFQPMSTRASSNPFIQVLTNSNVGDVHPFPEGLTDEEVQACVNRLRSAAQVLKVGLSIKQDGNGRKAWICTGAVKHRPRQAK